MFLSSYMLGITLVLLSVQGSSNEGTVAHICASGRVCSSSDTGLLASAFFEPPSRAQGGWARLRVITTDAGVSDTVRLRAAGFAEGFATFAYIDEMHRRSRLMRRRERLSQLRAFVEVQYAELVAAREAPKDSSDPSLELALVFLAQVEGIHAGYVAAAIAAANASGASPHVLSLIDILELNYDGDAFDILAAAASGVADFVSLRQRRQLRRSSRLARFASLQLSLAAADSLLSTVIPAYPLSAPVTSTYDRDAWLQISLRGRCTAAVVAAVEPRGSTANVSGVWAGHTTWGGFLELLRVYKTYDLRLDHPAVRHGLNFGRTRFSASESMAGTEKGVQASSGRRKARMRLLEQLGTLPITPGRVRWTFSSYPGIMTSTDDWYMLDSGLLVTETTTTAVNARALSQISPLRGIPSWLRAVVANVAAFDALSWAEAFGSGNSGTYNCGWLVLDAAAAESARRRSDGAPRPHGSNPSAELSDADAGWLLLVEQSPLRVDVRDVTRELLRDGVWASANRPFSPHVRADLGYPPEMHAVDAVERGATRPEYFSAVNSPRARILRREAPSVHDTASMLALMRLNAWRTDAESQGLPYVAVSARFDLAPPSDRLRLPDGGSDAKAASSADVLALRSLAVVGPAFSDAADRALPPFNWLDWVGPGFCGGTRGAPCPPAEHATAAQAVPVASLCTVARLPDHAQGVTPGAGGVVLPCEWDLLPAWLV